MTRTLSERRIVYDLAQCAGERVARKVIRTLQSLTDNLASGVDSGLRSIWEEVCVQVQGPKSVLWDAYDETVRDTVRWYLSELPTYEREALWLQTEAGIDWSCKEEADREEHPVLDEEIVDYLVRHVVYGKAGDWSNPRVRSFFDRYGY